MERTFRRKLVSVWAWATCVNGMSVSIPATFLVLVASLLLSSYLRRTERAQLETAFKGQTHDVSSILKERIDTYVEIVQLIITDESADGDQRLLFDSNDRLARRGEAYFAERSDNGGLRETLGYNLGGRKWQFQLMATPQYIAVRRELHSWFILIGGVLIALLLGAVLNMLIGRAESGKPTLLTPSIAGLVTAAIVLIFTWELERSASLRYQHEVRANTLRDLATVRGAAETAISKRLYLTLGLKAHVSVNPDMTEREFADMAALLMQEGAGIRSVTSIKDNVINDVYPRQGNESAIGLKLLEHPDQRVAAEYAIETGKPWLAGPIRLVQGGEAFVNRAPVFTTVPGGTPAGGDYWGMVSILIDNATLVSEITASVPENLAIALRGRSDRGEPGAIFLGDRCIESADPIVTEISLPTGSWQLYGVPQNGWPTSAPDVAARRVGGVVFALLTGALSFTIVQTTLRYREYSQRLEIAQHALRNSIMRYELVMEGASAGIWDWDVANKQVLFSSQWKAMRGYEDDEVGESESDWSSDIHADDKPRVLAAVKAHVAGETEIFEEEYRVRCKDGSWRYVLNRGKAIHDRSGSATRASSPWGLHFGLPT